VGFRARADFERDGIDPADCELCEDPGPDGTRLPRCLKIYLGPPAAGPRGHDWGMVFVPDRVDGVIEFQCLAFGVRHPPRNSRRWSVYQFADKRLHDKN
jgi:hypothetical protein